MQAAYVSEREVQECVELVSEASGSSMRLLSAENPTLNREERVSLAGRFRPQVQMRKTA
jgi:hypothetical protein